MKAIVRTQVRLPKVLADWLKEQARLEGRSMNGQLVEVLREAKKRAA